MIYHNWNLYINERAGEQQVLRVHPRVYSRQLQGTADQAWDKSL